MTNPSKAWALLTARGARLGGVGGGEPEMTASDVAAMLAGMPRQQFLAGMVKESGDFKSLAELERCTWTAAMRLADPVDAFGSPIKSKAWPLSHGQSYCRRLAGVAVYEFVIPRPGNCSNCKGRGWTVFEGTGIACSYCLSTGGEKLSSSMRSLLAGIPYTSWTAGWDGRYEDVYRMLCSWYYDARSHLRRAIRAAAEAA